MLKLIPANDLTNELMLSPLGSYGNRSHRLLFHKAEQAHLEMGPGPLTCILSAAAVVYDINDCATFNSQHGQNQANTSKTTVSEDRCHFRSIGSRRRNSFSVIFDDGEVRQ